MINTKCEADKIILLVFVPNINYFSSLSLDRLSSSLVIAINATPSPHRGFPISSNHIHLSRVCRHLHDRAL